MLCCSGPIVLPQWFRYSNNGSLSIRDDFLAVLGLGSISRGEIIQLWIKAMSPEQDICLDVKMGCSCLAHQAISQTLAKQGFQAWGVSATRDSGDNTFRESKSCRDACREDSIPKWDSQVEFYIQATQKKLDNSGHVLFFSCQTKLLAMHWNVAPGHRS